MKGIKIELNPLTVDNIIPNRIYGIKEIAELLMVSEQTAKFKLIKKRIKPISHKKYEHYKVFGSELLRYLNFSDDYEINKFEQ